MMINPNLEHQAFPKPKSGLEERRFFCPFKTTTLNGSDRCILGQTDPNPNQPKAQN